MKSLSLLTFIAFSVSASSLALAQSSATYHESQTEISPKKKTAKESNICPANSQSCVPQKTKHIQQVTDIKPDKGDESGNKDDVPDILTISPETETINSEAGILLDAPEKPSEETSANSEMEKDIKSVTPTVTPETSSKLEKQDYVKPTPPVSEKEIDKDPLKGAMDNEAENDVVSKAENVTKEDVPIYAHEVKFQAVIKYSGFDKPVTSCQAKIINETKGNEGKLFLLEAEYQIGTEDIWPKDTEASDVVFMDFTSDTPYGPADCKRHELKSISFTAQELNAFLSSNEPVIELQPENSVFIVFVNLQSEKIHRSVARWRETLDMANKIYRTGVASKKWTDGIILGVGNNGTLEKVFLPKGNFPKEIMTNSNILDLASDLSTKPRHDFSPEDILSSLSSDFNGEQKYSILYISDQFPSCRAAVKTIGNTAFSETQSVFFALPVSEISEKTGAITLESSRKIFKCVPEKKNTTTYPIIAFDLYERAANLDWSSAMKHTEKHAEKLEFSRDKF